MTDVRAQAHDLLVRTRNRIDRDGLDLGSYCGTPACLVGTLATESDPFRGVSLFGIKVFDMPDYREALNALLATAPAVPPLPGRPNTLLSLAGVRTAASARDVETIALTLGVKHGMTFEDGWPGRDGQRVRDDILAWIDRAIAATAPPPAVDVEPKFDPALEAWAETWNREYAET